MTKVIHVKVQNGALQHVLEEQIASRNDLSLNPELPPHLVLSDQVLEESNPPKTLLITLPVRLGDLMDRISYTLSGRDRLASLRGEEPLDLGRYILNNEKSLLLDKETGKELRLTDKERLLIRRLFNAKNHRMDRKTLLQDVWGYAETAETHTLETHLYRLRQKLHEFRDDNFIVVEDGFYCLNLPFFSS